MRSYPATGRQELHDMPGTLPGLIDTIDSSLQLSSYDERKKLLRGARAHQGKPLLTGRLLNLFGNQLEHRFQEGPAIGAED